MRNLWLTEAQARQIARHALDAAPDEACGIIGGIGERALDIVPVPNVADDPRRHYLLDPQAMTRAWSRLRDAGLDIIGFYHSHPKGDALPSRTDIALAAYPDTAWLIVGLKDGKPGFSAWTIRDGDARYLPLHIGATPPPEALAPVNTAQRVAIIAGGLLALALTLVIALSLLPPAPPIMTTIP